MWLDNCKLSVNCLTKYVSLHLARYLYVSVYMCVKIKHFNAFGHTLSIFYHFISVTWKTLKDSRLKTSCTGCACRIAMLVKSTLVAPNCLRRFVYDVLTSEHTCKTSSLGMYYMGDTNATRTGRRCIFWSQVLDWRREKYRFPDDTIQDLSNYCRNPSGKMLGPWCHYGTDTNEWEYCDVPLCPGICYVSACQSSPRYRVIRFFGTTFNRVVL